MVGLLFNFTHYFPLYFWQTISKVIRLQMKSISFYSSIFFIELQAYYVIFKLFLNLKTMLGLGEKALDDRSGDNCFNGNCSDHFNYLPSWPSVSYLELCLLT